MVPGAESCRATRFALSAFLYGLIERWRMGTVMERAERVRAFRTAVGRR